MSDQEKTPKAEPATPAPKGGGTPSGDTPSADTPSADTPSAETPSGDTPEELGGPKGPEPTRFGDWERNGRCSDF